MTPIFQHHAALRADFPTLTVAMVLLSGTDRLDAARLDPAIHLRTALDRLAAAPESELPAIRSWRAAYSQMGLKPTQYRCAAESLLRRLRTEGSLPALNPVVDFCNAVSAAWAIPLAVFDLDKIEGTLTVRYAVGDERYVTFDGTQEQPAPGEVIFADSGGWAHARCWVHQQSGRSDVSRTTQHALLVAEVLHERAADDLAAMTAALTAAFRHAGGDVPTDPQSIQRSSGF